MMKREGLGEEKRKSIAWECVETHTLAKQCERLTESIRMLKDQIDSGCTDCKLAMREIQVELFN